ncbi:MAG: fumarylacetoacetate hydrolase family protein [Terriglobales bacterium]
MHWVRFLQQGQACWGQEREGLIQVFAGSPLSGGARCQARAGIERLPLESVPLLPPCEPTKIVCIGRNYRAHAEELGNAVPQTPLFFLKPPSALVGHLGRIVLPPLSQQVEYEGEVGLVVGRRLRGFRRGEDPAPYVFGLTCVNDVTARDLQQSDPQWTRAKGFDTFCPVGPWVTTLEAGRQAPWAEIGVETRVNGEVRQQGNTRDWIFPLDQMLEAITAVMTLEPGDLIATGTPAGVGRLRTGDRVTVSVGGVGTLENSV